MPMTSRPSPSGRSPAAPPPAVPQAKHFNDSFYKERCCPRGPVPFLNPTRAHFPLHLRWPRLVPRPPSPIYHAWRSRDNRKGRHAAVVAREHVEGGRVDVPSPTDTWREFARGLWRMTVRYPVWDISYDVAISFTLGSVIWCINGCFAWLPQAAPASEFNGEVLWGGGLTGFIGATVFEAGSVLMVLEAVNENRSACFGWVLEHALEDNVVRLMRRKKGDCRHHHPYKRSLLKPRSVPSASSESGLHDAEGSKGSPGRLLPEERLWSWCPTWQELRSHYFKEIGFLASFSQLLGATIFWIAGIAALPPVYKGLHGKSLNGVFWSPQVIGGCGFVISSGLIMLEVQERWYTPNLRSLGWHIGFWNLVGAIGFTLCGALGYGVGQPGIEYASTLSTFVGSWAFLIGSLIQWYESLSKYPVTVEGDGCVMRGMENESRQFP